jgi:hypothetical protein
LKQTVDHTTFFITRKKKQWKKLNKETLFCIKCVLQFDKKIVFDLHLSLVHGKQIEIKTDAKCNSSESQLNKDPGGNNSYQCEICQACIKVKSNLKKHTKSVHEGKKPFRCEICDYCYSQKSDLIKHIKSVHEGKKPFKCEICDYSCSHKPSLKKHFDSVHEKKKKFKCEICDYSCS